MPDFITIHEAQPQRSANPPSGTRMPPPPPPQPPPPPAGYQPQAAAPRVVTVNPPPAQPAGQQYPPRPVAAGAPLPLATLPQHPPYAGPYANRRNTSVKISDLREQRPLTAEEAREALSEYYVYRFAKDEDVGGYSSDGERRKPSWKRVTQVKVPGISKHEAAKTVRELNRDTIPVAKKKMWLSDDEQRQIEIVLEELQRGDDAWFQTTLVQLDDQVKVKEEDEKDREKARARERGKERERERGRRRKHHHKEYPILFGGRGPHSKRPSSRAREPKKQPVTERVTLTAYYKRSPRLDVDPFAIMQHYRDAQRAANIQRMQQAHAQQTSRPEDGHPHSHPAPNRSISPPPPGGPARGRSPADHRRSREYQSHAQDRPIATIVQPGAQRPTSGNRRSHSPRRRSSPHPDHRGPPSTDESVFSDTFSAPDDGSVTPPSTDSYLSSPGASYERLSPRRPPGGGGGARFMESPLHYGIPPNLPSGGEGVHAHAHGRPTVRGRGHSISHPRYPNATSNSSSQATFFPPTAPSPPTPMTATTTGTTTTSSSSNPGFLNPAPLPYDAARQIADDAYARGRADTREETLLSMADRIARVAAATAVAATATAATAPQDNHRGAVPSPSPPPPPPPPPPLRQRPHIIQQQQQQQPPPPPPQSGGVRIVRGVAGPGEREALLERGMARLRVGDQQSRPRRRYYEYRYQRPRVGRIDNVLDNELDSFDRGIGLYGDVVGEAGFDHHDEEVVEDEEEEQLYEERGGRGSGSYIPVTPVETRRRAGSWERHRDGSRERGRDAGYYRAERVRWEDDRRRAREREEEYPRRRDSGVEVDVGVAAFGDSNPFASRPGLGRRTGSATAYAGYAGRGYD